MKRRQALGTGLLLALGCKMKPTGMERMNTMMGVRIDDNSFHPLIDMPYWEKLRGNELTGLLPWMEDPRYLLSLLEIRERAGTEKKFGSKKRQVDVFFWSGAPAQKAWLTRYGGAPFRSRSKPWPTRNGKQATFLGQLCFRDSKDLFARKINGDLLLIFSFERGMYESDPDDADNPIWAEWVTIDEVSDPYSTGDIVPNAFFVPSLSGVRCRTYDYLLQPHDRDKLLSLFGEKEPRRCALVSLPATKIGETYFEVQTGWDPREWIQTHRSDAQCVGCFYSVSVSLENCLMDVAYQHSPERKTNFEMGDPGHLVLFDTQQSEAVAYYIAG